MSAKPVPKFEDAYHARQWEVCYDSTRAFFDFLETQGVTAPDSKSHIVDLCTGTGANLYWLKQRCPNLKLTGVEIDPRLCEWGEKTLAERGVGDVSLAVGDVYELDKVEIAKPDGVMALQTISWLPDEVAFVAAAASLDADWIALTGLMIEGSHTFRTVINNHADPDKGVNFYNTFSLDYVSQMLGNAGYGDVTSVPFDIGIDLAKSDKPSLGTYTETTEDGRRLQISGALLMSWRFLLAKRA